MDKKKKSYIIGAIVIVLVWALCFGLGFYMQKNNNSKREDNVKDEVKQEENKEEKEDKEEPEEEEKPVEPVETPPEEEEIKINIDEVIKKYELESIRTYIEKDKDFFKEYASAVLNNKNIDYPKQVLLMFKAFEANKQYLNKEYLLSSVKQLRVINGTNERGTATYEDAILTITIPETISNSVFMHELMHFVDYRITEFKPFFCYDNGKVTYVEGGCKNIYYFYTNYNRRFIIETGAEVNTYRYYGYFSGGYTQVDNIYTMLSYLLGEQEMDDIYFSPNTFGALFEALLKYDITIDEYLKFMQDASFLSIESNFQNTGEKESNKMVEIIDFLSKVYKNKYKRDWDEDKEFSYMMRMLIRSPYSWDHIEDGTVRDKFKNTKNLTDKEKDAIIKPIDNEIIFKQIKKYELNRNGGNTYQFFINDGSLIIFRYVNVSGKHRYLAVKYDIKSEKVTGYSLVPYFNETIK